MIKKPLALALIALASIGVMSPQVAEAQLTNCFKDSRGQSAWSYCSGTTANAPYTTQHVIVVDCCKSFVGCYTSVGDWARRWSYSTVWCEMGYVAYNRRIWFK